MTDGTGHSASQLNHASSVRSSLSLPSAMPGGALVHSRHVVSAASIFILLFSIILNVIVPGLGIILVIALVAAVFSKAPYHCIELMIAALLFQNVTIAVSMQQSASLSAISAARGTNFAICVVLWGFCALRYFKYRQHFHPINQKVMAISFIPIGLIFIYFLYGYYANGDAAIVYLRNYLMPLLLFQIAICLPSRFDAAQTLWIGRLLLMYCFVEALFGASFLQMVSADVYLALGKGQMEPSTSGVRDDFSVQLFNTSLLGEQGMLHRLNGPNLHPISLGYALASFALICLSVGRYAETLCYLPLLVFSGSKGSLIYLMFTALGMAISNKYKASIVMIGMAVLALGYVAVAFIIGREMNDYHILGLMGSIRAFLAAPLGSGLGAGGNLSTIITVSDWQMAQHLGYTEVPVESAIGVALYQMGIAAFAFFVFYLWLAWNFWKRYIAVGNQTLLFGSCAVVIIVANALFQEEALFAPLCLGLVLLFVGSEMGRTSKRSESNG